MYNFGLHASVQCSETILLNLFDECFVDGLVILAVDVLLGADQSVRIGHKCRDNLGNCSQHEYQ